ncbi:MAG: Ig-like domain-containing protein, partial [Oscillospiraceae bacterium]
MKNKFLAMVMVMIMILSMVNVVVFGNAKAAVDVVTIPADNAINVAIDTTITLDFGMDNVDAATVNNTTVKLNGSNKMIENFIYDSNQPTKIVLKPRILEKGTRYHVDLNGITVNAGASTVTKRINFTTAVSLPTNNENVIVNRKSKNFDNISDPKGYFLNWGGEYTNEKISNGVFSFDKEANKASYMDVNLTGFEASNVNKIAFRVRATGDATATPGEYIKIYYKTAAKPEYSEGMTLSTDNFIADGTWYTVFASPTVDSVDWAKQILGFRMDCMGAATHFEFDYINLLEDYTQVPIMKRYDFKGYANPIMAVKKYDDLTQTYKDFGIEVKAKSGAHFFSEGVDKPISSISKIVVRMRTKSELRMAMYITDAGWNLGQAYVVPVWTPDTNNEFKDYVLDVSGMLKPEDSNRKLIQFTLSLAGGTNDHGVNCSGRDGDYDVESVIIYGKEDVHFDKGCNDYSFKNSQNPIIGAMKNATAKYNPSSAEITTTDSSSVVSNTIALAEKPIPIKDVEKVIVRLKTNSNLRLIMNAYGEPYVDETTPNVANAIWLPTKGGEFKDYVLDLSALKTSKSNFLNFALSTTKGTFDGVEYTGTGVYEIESIKLCGYNYVDPSQIAKNEGLVFGDFDSISSYNTADEA